MRRVPINLSIVFVLTLSAMLLLGGCASMRSSTRGGPVIESGVASYYAHKYHGRRTASGEVFDMNAMTAAHKTLPFGMRVRVTNMTNGKSVVVRINDRGPFVKGRVIDLSLAAAKKIDLIGPGTAKVQLQRVSGGEAVTSAR